MGGSGGGGDCYAELKRLFHLEKVEVKNCQRTTTIDTSLRTVKYTYSYVVKQSPSQKFWFHLIPQPRDAILSFSANDEEGGLRSDYMEHGRVTEARIYYRDSVKHKKNRRFAFEYELRFMLTRVRHLSKDLYVYHDWIGHTNEVEKLELTVRPPEGARVVSSHPSMGTSGKIEFGNIPPFAPITCDMVFSISRTRRNLALTTLGIIGSSLLGNAFLLFLNPWVSVSIPLILLAVVLHLYLGRNNLTRK